mmetsp:Transcript_32387/g.48083  ORF Transcript_32387/g.48083 Transcript_32387/m.48083 type:complete len:352 (-) Transcript_32387:394-1449(-)
MSYRRNDSCDLTKHLQTVGVHHSKTTKGRNLIEGLNKQRSRGLELHLGRLELRNMRRILHLCSPSLLRLLPENFRHLASDLCRARKNNRGVARLENSRVLLDCNQGCETLDWLELAFLLEIENITGLHLFILSDTLNGHADRVSGTCTIQHLLMLLNGKDLFVLETRRHDTNNVSRANSSLLNRSCNDLSNALDVIDARHRKTKRSIRQPLRWLNEIVQGIEKGEARYLHLGLEISLPTLVPRSLVGLLREVIAIESRVRDEWDLLGLESDYLEHLCKLILDLIEPLLRPVAGVHLVDSDNDLLNTQEVEQTCMLARLAFLDSEFGVGLRDRGLKATLFSRDQQHSHICRG